MAIDKLKIRKAVIEVLQDEFGEDLKTIYFLHVAHHTSDFKVAAVLKDERYLKRPIDSELTAWLEGNGEEKIGFNNRVINRYFSLMKDAAYPISIITYLLNEEEAWDNPVAYRGEIIFAR